MRDPSPRPPDCNAALVLADGTVFWGRGIGAAGTRGRRGLLQHRDDRLSGNPDRSLLCRADHHLHLPAYRQCRHQSRGHRDRRPRRRAASSCAAAITEPANWRADPAARPLAQSASARRALPASTRRRLTRLIRDRGAPNGVIAYDPRRRARHRRAAGRGGGLARARRHGSRPRGHLPPDATNGTRRRGSARRGYGRQDAPRFHVVAVDYGAKRNILRMLADHGCRVTVVPATASAEDILRHEPDGIFLSNGPGDPAATGGLRRAGAARADRDRQADLRHLPRPSAAGAGARRPDRARWTSGHRGANHPVKDLATGKVEITSQNHGFVVDARQPAAGVEPTHRLAVRRLQRRAAARRTGRSSRCSTTPKPAPARRTAIICSSALSL